MKNLAIVPARGGSKRLPGKNIKKLNDIPLIHYTLKAILNSEKFDTIILSSDDENILKIGGQLDGITLEKRDPELAGDTIKVIDLLKKIASRPGYEEMFDTIGLFLPTCPFRTSRHIKEGMELLTQDDFSVVSVTTMEDPVQLSLTIDENNVMNPEALLSPSPLVTGNTRSQDYETYYRVNGGFYIAWLEKFKEKKNFFQGQVKAYKMDRLYSTDIDYELDFEWAEFLIRNEYLKLN